MICTASSNKCNFHSFCESDVFDAASSGHNEISAILTKLEEKLLEKVNAIEARLTKIEDKPVATEEMQH